MNTRIQVTPLRTEHLLAAAGLVVANYRQARQHEPLLPARHGDAGAILPLLQGLARKHKGVVATHGDRVVGFLLGQTSPSFRGHRSVYVPEWAHAAVPEDRQDHYRAMYEAISADWVADGCGCHLISVLADASDVVDTFFWLEFGMTAVDALRGLSSVHGGASDVEIRRACPDDADAVAELTRALQRHLAGPPTFKTDSDDIPTEEIAKRLADPAQACWVAWNGGEPVAYWRIQGANTSASYIITDPGTASVTGAFTKEPFRGRGIGLAMLHRSMEWATAAGYVRCAVDFEPHNSLGMRFWLKHFRPVCYSLIRRVQGKCS